MLTLDKETAHMKSKLAVDYADLIYNGKWFSPLAEALTAFAKKANENCTGTVKLKLYKGNMINAGITSPNSPVFRRARHLRRERLRSGAGRGLHQHLGSADQGSVFAEEW